MEIPENLKLDFDSHQNIIKNITDVLNNLEKEDDKYLLEFYIKKLNEEPSLDKNMIKLILDKANERLNTLNNVNTLQELFIVAKNNTNKLSNISIIDTKKEMNDKINGFRKDVTYIKLNNLDEIYEVRNVDKVKSFLNNKEIIDTLKEEEIIRFLRDNSEKIDTKEIDNRKNDELNSDTVKKEIESINDSYLREMFVRDQNLILKERVEIDKYVKTNMPEEKIEYGLNSNGERIYTAGDKIIKFEGTERNMQILDQEKVEKNEVNQESFRKYKGSSETDTEFLNKEINSVYEFDGKEDLLNTIIDAIFSNFGVTDEQIKFLTNFLEKCVSNQELGIINPANLQEVFDKYYNYAKTDSSVVNDEIKEIFDRYDRLLNKTDENEYEKDYTVENTKVLKFVPNKRDNITGLDKAAFISVTVILEGTLIGTLIFALLALVK